MSQFAIVDQDNLDAWSLVELPTLDTTDFDISQNYHFISVGLFNYDPQIFLYTYYRDIYNKYFGSGKYDGWSIGSEMYF